MEYLRNGPQPQREAAVARLRVLGGRAISRLALLLAPTEPPAARVAALQVLEGAEDQRARDLALRALGDEHADVAGAAVQVLRPWVLRDDGLGVMDALTAAALQTGLAPAVRLAALDALAQLPRSVIEPLLTHVPEAVRTETGAADAAAARTWIVSHGDDAALTALQDLVAHAAERERAGNAAAARQWQAVRGAAHLALARRGSRLALYDLREAFATGDTSLPPDCLAAIALIGDATCLESLGRAWAASGADRSWRDRVAQAARDIVARERLTGRHAAVKRVQATWPGLLGGRTNTQGH